MSVEYGRPLTTGYGDSAKPGESSIASCAGVSLTESWVALCEPIRSTWASVIDGIAPTLGSIGGAAIVGACAASDGGRCASCPVSMLKVAVSPYYCIDTAEVTVPRGYRDTGPIAAIPVLTDDPVRDGAFWAGLTGWQEHAGAVPVSNASRKPMAAGSDGGASITFMARGRCYARWAE